eukprot:scaffold82820_cov70-Phaeocystis_antarctica.AAC.2
MTPPSLRPIVVTLRLSPDTNPSSPGTPPPAESQVHSTRSAGRSEKVARSQGMANAARVDEVAHVARRLPIGKVEGHPTLLAAVLLEALELMTEGEAFHVPEADGQEGRPQHARRLAHLVEFEARCVTERVVGQRVDHRGHLEELLLELRRDGAERVTRERVQEDRGAHGAEAVTPFEDAHRVAFGAQRVAQGQARRPRAYHSNVSSWHH